MKKDPWRKREAERYERPIASREFILSVMEKAGEPMSFDAIAGALDIREDVDREALGNRLRAMVRQGQLVADRQNTYAVASRMELVAGRISAHPDGYGFLIPDNGEQDVFLSHRQMRTVFHGDRALVRIRGQDRRGRTEGEIVEVIERNTDQLVGRFYFQGRLAFIEPLNNRITHEVLVRDQDVDHYRSGQIVVAGVVEQPTSHSLPAAEILEVLGEHLTPDLEVEIALRNNDVPVNFSDEALEAADRMPIEVAEADKKHRRDLRECPFVTIDGEDAKDFDDAVWCEKRKGGGWRLYVAIADVAHYVACESALDIAARERATSVYFPQYVVPMLPEKLSNGLCSLNPEVDRLVMVCEMTISAQGRVGSYCFYEGVIRSAARLTYTLVAEMLGDDKARREKSRRDYAHVLDNVDELYNLYQVLARRRDERGALDFDSTELEFEFDEAGSVTNIYPGSRNEAHKLIEECMLCANVSAARFVSNHGITGLYRVHEGPDPEKIEYLREFLGKFGIELGGGAIPTPLEFQEVIDQLRGKKNGHVLQVALLRSLTQAVYQTENKGHFGLNYNEYTHFTSPIRRYPDLLTHRLIKSVIHSKRESKYVQRFGRPERRRFYPYEDETVIALGEHCSFAERRGETAVYDVLEWIKCDYISDRVGDTLDGAITGVAQFGFFVELENIYVEGLVHVSTLPGDYFDYDRSSQCLVGRRSRRVYGLGDSVTVQVARANVDERKVDFELVSHSPLKSRRAQPKRKKERQSRKGDKGDRGAGRKARPRKRKGKGRR